MATETEGSFGIGDVSLYTKTWTPQGPIKAKLVFIHGFSDHIGRYYGFFPSLAARGIQVFGWDQRGWGRSVKKPAERGLTGPSSQVIADIAAFIKDKLPSDVPLFVMGSSMGGQQAITLASDPNYQDIIGQVRGWILESPFIAFPPGEEPSFLKVFFGKLLGRFLPHQHLHSAIPQEYFSRDPAVVQNIKEDSLCHDTGTLEGLAGMLERTDNIQNGKVKLSSQVNNLFLVHGTADRTTSFDASKKWFDEQTIEDAKHKPYEGCYHQLHSDFCKEEFYQDIGDWILERVGDSNDGTAAKVESKL